MSIYEGSGREGEGRGKREEGGTLLETVIISSSDVDCSVPEVSVDI